MAPTKILVLGSGLVAKPCVDYLHRNTENHLTVGESSASGLLLIPTTHD